MSFPVRLRQAREEAGLSQEELAARVGVHRQSITRWEKKPDLFSEDSHVPSGKICEALANALGKTLYWLMGINEDFASMMLDASEREIVMHVRKLNAEGVRVLLETIKDMEKVYAASNKRRD